jgi:hypothetical protein
MKTLNDLPGLAALAANGAAGPLFDIVTRLPSDQTPLKKSK